MGSVSKAGEWEGVLDLDQLISGFHELKTAQRYPIIELKSNYGISALRDMTETSGSASVGNNGSEHTLSTGTTTSSEAVLSTAERGRYMPGAECQAGIGFRSGHTFTSDQKAEWGYFDDSNGFGFGKDATGAYVFILRGGTYTKIYQSNWNHDRLDGSLGPANRSGLELDISRGNIFEIDFTYYGYGSVTFSVVLPDRSSRQVTVPVHRFAPSQQTSVVDPNLPLRATVNNGSTTVDVDGFVGGRQFSVFLPYMPNRRINGDWREVSSIGTTFVPLVSFRKKSAYESVSVKVEGVDLVPDQNLIYQLRLDSSLTGASWVTPSNTTASETACEIDKSATAVSGGEMVFTGIAGSPGVGFSSRAQTSQTINLDIPGTQSLTLCVRRVSGTGATATSAVRWREEW